MPARRARLRPGRDRPVAERACSPPGFGSKVAERVLLRDAAASGGPAAAKPIHEIDAPSGRWPVEPAQRAADGATP